MASDFNQQARDYIAAQNATAAPAPSLAQTLRDKYLGGSEILGKMAQGLVAGNADMVPFIGPRLRAAIEPGKTLSPEGQGVIRDAAPAFYKVKHAVDNSDAAQAILGSAKDLATNLGGKWDDAVNTVSGQARSLAGAPGEAFVREAGRLAPFYAGNLRGAKKATSAWPDMASIAPELPNALEAPATRQLGRPPMSLRDDPRFQPLLPDGAHSYTLDHERAANARMAEDGVLPTDVPPSEFAGRQATHEGAVAGRDQVPRSLSTLPGPESHLADSVPSNATVYASHDPETGALQGHAVVVPRPGGMQLIDTHVDPAFQRAGIGTDLLKSAAHDAHQSGVPLLGDTSVSPAHMASAQKSGYMMHLNPNVEEGENPKYGTSLNSTDGQPVFSMPPPTSADDAHVDDPLPGSYISRQAYAEGGEVAPALSTLTDLVAKYAPEAKKNLNKFLEGSQVRDAQGNPKTLYHITPKDFSVFKPGGDNPTLTGPGIYMSPDPTNTPAYHNVGARGSDGPFREGTNVMPLHANLKSPLMLDTPDMLSWARGVYANGSGEFPELLHPTIKQKLMDDGYDGIIYGGNKPVLYDNNVGLGDQPGGHEEVIAFHPNQVKSAVGNVGSFDPTDPDITKASGGVVRKADGGEVAPALSTLASLVAKYGDKPAAVDNFKQWFGNSVTHDNGTPKVLYTGTSKDKDFPSFNVGRHGVWFTSDPESASAYAKDNDSQGHTYTGGRFVSTNTASRVIPAYVKAENPYKGDLPPELRQAQNYKAAQSGFFDQLRAAGHDSWIPASDGGNTVVALRDPTQIKSAVGNSGDFSSAAKPMNKADGGTVVGGLSSLGRLIAEYAPERLKGLPSKATIKGMGTIDVGPNPAARAAAADYMQQAGIKSPPQLQYVQADPELGARIAAAFDAMPHAPDDPKVKASYDAMIKETLVQYQHMKAAGMNVEFIPPGQAYPYGDNLRSVIADINDNKHLYVFPTNPEETQAGGFGSDPTLSGNPLLHDSGETFNGVPATNNDVFRAVHDYFGHAKEGVGFRANGEENAWQQHARMYSDLARPAMTTETRGQNSWVNFGPHGEYNQLASGDKTIYAPQKTGLLPDEFNQIEDPDLHFLHMGNPDQAQVTLDPKMQGRGIRGAEARRGGPKVTSLYPWDIDPSQVEQGLESKTPYHVSVPKSQMYDMSADPEGHLASADSYPEAEQAVKDAGYAGYHVPDGQGLFKGQARMFQPTQASRLGPGAATPEEENLASGFARGGAVRRFADGGEAGIGLGVLGDLVKQYAPEAEHLSQAVADKGAVTYNPTTGDVHSSGYAVPTPTTVERSQVLDHAPDPAEFHQYMMDHQDAFDEDPKAAIHVASDPKGFHIMSVVHHEPDLGRAQIYGKLNDATGIHDISGNVNHSVTTDPLDALTGDQGTAPSSEEEAYFANPKMARNPMSSSSRQDALDAPMIQTPWTQGQQTVSGARRNAFPGIYDDPRSVIAGATAKVGPEDPLLRRLFGVSRGDLSDQSLSRQGNELGVLPGAKANPQGAKAALGVMTPQNTQRLVDVLSEARKSPSLFQGMTGWYNMDPLYEHFERIWGDQAPEKYRQFNTLSGMASPGSDVGTEIARGSAANWLHNQGRFDDFVRYGGGVDGPGARNAPSDLADLPGHVYHRTAQAIPMSQYLESGSMQMKSPKVPAYIQASGVPATGFQTDLPVGDAHWARGVGLADTRGDATLKGKPVVPGSSVSTPEMQTLHPWWRDQVAAQSGLDSVPAQALAWGAFSPITGVKSAIGAPKMEILSSQIGKLAARMGISPEDARDLVISGKAGAFSGGGSV